MTAPNPRYNECNIMVTRRVHGRLYRLRPGKKTNAIVGYVVGIVAKHYKLEINAYNVMSTHYHCGFYDPNGQASNYARDAHSMIARLVIATYGEDDESLWSPVSCNILEMDETVPSDGIGQIAYIACQGVAAGVVKKATSWPGAKGWWPMREQTFKRPKRFFDGHTWWPGKLTEAGNPAIHWAKTATIKFVRPRGYDDIEDNELAVMVNDAIKRREELAHAKWKDVPGAFPGRKSALLESRRRKGRKPEAKRGAKRVPRIHCSDPERRTERLEGLRTWRRNYEMCRREFRTNREVLFPMGTYKMKVDLDVNVDAALPVAPRDGAIDEAPT